MSRIADVTPVPALVWDRIDENTRRTRNLLTFFALLLIPFAMALWPLAAYGIAYAAPWIVFDSGAWMGLALLTFVTMVAGACWVGLSRYHSSGASIFRRARAVPAAGRETELRRAVENLCIGAGLPVPAVLVIETRAPNAFTAGVDPASAQIAVTRGLLELLDRRELEGVLAHEISHIGNGDVRLGSALAGCLAILRAPLDALQVLADVAGMILGPFAENTGPLDDSEAVSFQAMTVCIVLALLGLAMGVITLFELIATLGGLALTGDLMRALRDGMAAEMSVKLFLGTAAAGPAFLLWGGRILGAVAGRSLLEGRELLADAEAFALTHDAEGLACALAKIDAVGAATPGADPANAHLFVADPIRRQVRWWNAPVMAHPPVEERIAALLSLAPFPPESLERAQAAARKWAEETDPDPRPATVDVRESESEELIPVYEAPDGWSAVVARVADQAALTVLDANGSGGFIKVRTPDGVIGYLSRQAPRRRKLQQPIRLYEAPDGWSRMIAELPADAELTPLDSKPSGSFIRVRTPDGLTGYVSRWASDQRRA